VIVVKKWWRKCSVQAALGRREKRRRTMRGRMEDSEAGEVLTWAREAVRQPGDDSKVKVGEELGSGGDQARRGEEESGDGCYKGRVRASAFYRGQREVEVLGTQWLASMPGFEDDGYSG
jgi:hypothetical protein